MYFTMMLSALMVSVLIICANAAPVEYKWYAVEIDEPINDFGKYFTFYKYIYLISCRKSIYLPS